MAQIFNSVVSRKPRYNNFNLSREKLLSGRIGQLIPVQVEEVVPGDLFKEDVNFLIRFSPMSAPAMVRFNVHFHSFFVPYRIITPRNGEYSTWEKFIMDLGKPLSEVATLPYLCKGVLSVSEVNNAPVRPYWKYFTIGSLWDYMDLPTASVFPSTREYFLHKDINLMPFLAYQKVYDDWFRRDQIEVPMLWPLNLGRVQSNNFANSEYEAPEPADDGREFDLSTFLNNLFILRTRNYERDYFTSALPEPQFGDDVTIGGDVIAGANAAISLNTSSPIRGYIFNESSVSGEAVFSKLPSQEYSMMMNSENASYTMQLAPILSEGQTGLPFSVASLSGVGSTISINELRLAMQLQGVREKINRGGTRFIEIHQNIYGIAPSDGRLQRVQYLGGFSSPISVGAVIQQSQSADTPQGTLTGNALGANGGRLFKSKRKFDEHGYVVTLMSITPRSSYYGGIPRKFTKLDPIDYYIPDYDHLGEQEIDKTELYAPLETSDAPAVETFGYTPRYSELKSSISTVNGEFRTTLDNWHVSRDFVDYPLLSPEFIHAESEDFDRLFTFENIENTSNEHFQAQVYIRLKAKRPMSKYSTPYTFY